MTVDAHAAVWNALTALPPPVDFDAARAAGIAATQAAGVSAQQFGSWFDLNGTALVVMLNSV